ncbi:MAG TPA: hypothetical protein VFG87_22250 [Amycolatopsis sp.]|jgi:hypothetical protein|nr:hypothetical protein [Amycolatopsis sp.]
MWAPWAVALTAGFLGNLTGGDTALAIVFGLLLALDLAGAAVLRRRRVARAHGHRVTA